MTDDPNATVHHPYAGGDLHKPIDPPDHDPPLPAHDDEPEWELPEGTTRATLKDGTTLYTLPDGTQRHVHDGEIDRYIFKPVVGAVDKASVKDLADAIRDDVDPNYSQKVHPDDQHLHATAVEVTKELGMDPNPLNVSHVAGLINNRVLAPSREFPKMKYRDAQRKGPDGQPQAYVEERVVENAQAEADLGDGWRNHHWPDEARRMEDPAAAIDPATGLPVGTRSEAGYVSPAAGHVSQSPSNRPARDASAPEFAH